MMTRTISGGPRQVAQVERDSSGFRAPQAPGGGASFSISRMRGGAVRRLSAKTHSPKQASVFLNRENNHAAGHERATRNAKAPTRGTLYDIGQRHQDHCADRPAPAGRCHRPDADTTRWSRECRYGAAQQAAASRWTAPLAPECRRPGAAFVGAITFSPRYGRSLVSAQTSASRIGPS